MADTVYVVFATNWGEMWDSPTHEAREQAVGIFDDQDMVTTLIRKYEQVRGPFDTPLYTTRVEPHVINQPIIPHGVVYG